MKRALIDELYDRSHVVYEVPYESSIVDPTVISVHKQKVWDRYQFAELLVKRVLEIADAHCEVFQTERDHAVIAHIKQSIMTDFGVEK